MSNDIISLCQRTDAARVYMYICLWAISCKLAGDSQIANDRDMSTESSIGHSKPGQENYSFALFPSK